MDTPILPADETNHSSVPPVPYPRRQTVWSMPLGALLNAVLSNQDAIRRFLSLTGGSILYCLSALSIVYGITQIIGPPLAKSGVLADILPCVGVLNIYELALLVVLVPIVVWRHVTDDAISLVILVALFLVASGMTLGVVAPSGLNVCLLIGIFSVLLGLAKLLVLRRYIALRLEILPAVGLALILAWNFLGPSLMARPLMARTSTEELRRSQWLWGWLILLSGAVLVLVPALRREYAPPGDSRPRPPFLHTHSMAAIFALVVLGAMGFHQYGIAYMFAVDYRYGDFIPLVAAVSLLLLELIRSLGKRFEGVEEVISWMPLGLAVLAVANKLTVAPPTLGIGLISYPPVVLGLTGLALLWMGVRRRMLWLSYTAVAYGLGVLLTISRGHELNWPLFGGGLVVVLLVLGALRRSPTLCFAAILVLTVGLGSTDAFARFAKQYHLGATGASAGVAGLGTVLLALAFGRRTPAVFILVGTAGVVIGAFDALPKSLHWMDLVVLVALASMFAGLLVRTKNVGPALVLWIPVFPRAYLLTTRMSSWNFVALSFLLLFGGAFVSLFLKRKLMPEKPSTPEPPKEGCDPLPEGEK